jgi:porin
MTILLGEPRGRGVWVGSSDHSKSEALTRSLAVSYGFTAIAVCITLMLPARAQSAPPGEYPYHPFRSPFPHQTAAASDEFREKYLFGDWLGYRSELAARGIKPSLLFIVDPFASVMGGLRRGVTNYDLLCLDVLFDSNELLGVAGGQFHVGFAVNFGTSLSRHYVGNTFPIQLADVAGAQPRLTYLSYTQALAESRLTVRLGRVTVNSVFGEEFMGSEYFKAMASVAFNLIPIGLFLNAPGAFGYPETTWGARIKFEPVSQFYVMAGAYNGDPTVKAGYQHGLDFSLQGPLFAIGEVSFRFNYGDHATGLPRNIKAGVYFNGGQFDVLGTRAQTRTVHGLYGLYILGDQVVWRWGDSSQNRHLDLYGAFLAAPGQHLNSAPYFFDTGLVAYGPVGRRPKDFAAMGIAYGRYAPGFQQSEQSGNPASMPITMRDFETTVEWTYGCTIRPGLVVQPSLQYLVHPKGTTAIPNALAIGVNLVINF